MIRKVAETELLLLQALLKEDYPDQESLCKAVGVKKSSGSKALKRLNKRNLIRIVQRGKYHNISLNRNKKGEVKRVLAIWEKFHDVLKDKTKVLVRVHDFEAYSGCYVPSNYDRAAYRKHRPNNRFCVTREIENVGTVTLTLSELDSNNNSIQIFITPFYLVIPIGVSQRDLDDLIYQHNNRRIRFIIEFLKKEVVYVGDSYHLVEGSAALVDDWLAELAVRNHLKNRNIDESHYLIPEFEVHGPDLAVKLHKIINLRKLIIENKISELALAKYVEEISKKEVWEDTSDEEKDEET